MLQFLRMMRNELVPEAIDVNGREVFYMQSGDRESKHVLLMLHGFMSDYRSLQMVAENIELGTNTVLLLPDLPGFGSSEALSDHEPSLDEYVDWVVEFLKVAAPEAKNITLMGYSFGCYLAIELAARRSDALNGLVLLTPVIKVAAAVRLYTSGMEMLAKLSLDAAQVLYKWRPHFDLTNLYLARSRHPDRVLAMLRHRREDLSALQPKVVLGLSRDLIDIDLLGAAPRVTCPVFMVLAKDDTLAVNSASEEFGRQLGSPMKEIHILQKCGHMVPFEEPELVVTLLNRRYFRKAAPK
jgi:pimeloyl-ACP methyl ester carboxylesterase